MRPVPQQAVDFIAKHEGKRLKAYPDPASGGDPWTIGWGHTGPEVKPGLMINEATARKYLRDDLAIASGRLESRIGAVVDDLTDNQYAALISFVFNVGAGEKWTIWKRLKARQFDQIPIELMKFVNAAGKKNQGLVNRRAAEVALWSTDEPGSEDVQFTSASLRAMQTPPTPSDPVPARKSGTLWTAIAAPFIGAWIAVKEWIGLAPDWLRQAIDIVNPFSTQSTIVQHMVAGLATTAAVVGVINAFMLAKKKSEARS